MIKQPTLMQTQLQTERWPEQNQIHTENLNSDARIVERKQCHEKAQERLKRFEVEEAQMRREKELGIRASRLTPEQTKIRNTLRARYRYQRLREARGAQGHDKAQARMMESQRCHDKAQARLKRFDEEEALMRKEKELGIRATCLTPEQKNIRYALSKRYRYQRLREARRAREQGEKEIGMEMTRTPIIAGEDPESFGERGSGSSSSSQHDKAQARLKRFDEEEAQMRMEKELGIRATGLTPEQRQIRNVLRNRYRNRRLTGTRRARGHDKAQERLKRFDEEETKMRREKELGIRPTGLTPERREIRHALRKRNRYRRSTEARRAREQEENIMGMTMARAPTMAEEDPDSSHERESAASSVPQNTPGVEARLASMELGFILN